MYNKNVFYFKSLLYSFNQSTINFFFYSILQSMKLVNRYQWDSYQVQLLLQCTAEHGYGNWEEISKHFNRIIHDEYNSGERTYRTATGY